MESGWSVWKVNDVDKRWIEGGWSGWWVIGAHDGWMGCMVGCIED